MSRSTTMAELLRIARLAERSARTGEDAAQVIGEDVQDAERRRLIRGAAAGASVLAAGALAPRALAGAKQLGRAAIATLSGTQGVAVVGAGFAGLACATELARLGVDARVYEARTRVGGRCWSVRGVFPGQVVEHGAEFIGSSHHAMLGYARALGLQVEAVPRRPSLPLDASGTAYSEVQVLEEYRAFVDCIRPDLDALGTPVAGLHSDEAATFDFMTLDEYMTVYGAGTLLRSVIGAACTAEFGVEPGGLSAIAFLRFVHGDTRAKLGAAGPMPGEQLHVVGGNDLIAIGLASRLPRPVELGYRLVAISKRGGTGLRLTFDVGGRYIETRHPAVVLALPFSVLRDVDIDASVGLPDWKRLAIRESSMGDASKLSIGFKRPYWRSDASGVATLPALQNVWESSPSTRTASRAVLAFQAGGAASRLMTPGTAQGDAERVIQALERLMPGATQAVRRDYRGRPVATAHNWSQDVASRGAYAAPRPGYFTTVANLEARAVGNLHFAGDHTSSFYEWQGFMEGAVLSGLRAAAEVRGIA